MTEYERITKAWEQEDLEMAERNAIDLGELYTKKKSAPKPVSTAVMLIICGAVGITIFAAFAIAL